MDADVTGQPSSEPQEAFATKPRRQIFFWAVKVVAISSVACWLLLPDAGAAGTELAKTQGAGNVTLSFEDKSIKEVIDLFARNAGVDIVDASAGHARSRHRVSLSADLVDKPWRPSLETLLETCDLDLVEAIPGSGIYKVVPNPNAEATLDDTVADPGIVDVLGPPAIVLIALMLGFALNSLFAVAMWADASRLRKAGRRSFLLPPFFWALGVVASGLLGVGIYWAIHHSTLREQDG